MTRYADCPLPGDHIITTNGLGHIVIASSHGRDDGAADDFLVLLVLAPPILGVNFLAMQVSAWHDGTIDNAFRIITATGCSNIGAAVQVYEDFGGDVNCDELPEG